MIGRREDRLLQASAGLEGGIVASGSTCGVVSGGALGLALMHDTMLQERGIAAEAWVLSLIGEYVRWFEESYGSSCRERSGVDFYTTMGQLRYFLPGDRVARCFWHIRGAMRHLYDTYQGRNLLTTDRDLNKMQGEPMHCAQAVLRGIRSRTGVGDPLLERLSFVFDGGVGLSGGACGALAGAIMSINLLLGMNIRDANFFQAFKSFIVGYVNLLLNEPIDEEPDPFSVGKNILDKFREKAGAIDCRNITEKKFSDWTGFQKHIFSSDKCAGLIELATTEASNAIQSLI
jgi:C_GCAxxG_C_C family probable redox protein